MLELDGTGSAIPKSNHVFVSSLSKLIHDNVIGCDDH
jgi:hypothetical protein